MDFEIVDLQKTQHKYLSEYDYIYLLAEENRGLSQEINDTFEDTERLEYDFKALHGNFGNGTFTFYGGHDPEDYQHFVGDPTTDLSLHRNSPGYRIILNNILFPAARKKERKT